MQYAMCGRMLRPYIDHQFTLTGGNVVIGGHYLCFSIQGYNLIMFMGSSKSLRKGWPSKSSVSTKRRRSG